MSSHKPRGYSVNDFLSWDERKELILQPKFQRRDVWTPKAKSHLIDTILRGLPIPIVFIRQNVDPELRRTVREVVDGQQRLRAVIDYSKDLFPVARSQNHEYGGMTFSQLPGDAKQHVLSYEFSVVILEGASDADVLEIFARLNTYAQTLTKQELLNSAYFGEFKQTMYALGREHLEFWRQNRILTDREIIRMAEAELVSELAVCMLTGIQRRRTGIEDLYKSKDDTFPERGRVEREFKAVIDAISACLGTELRANLFSRHVVFHSLFCAFHHVMFGIPTTPELGASPARRHMTQKELARIKASLLTFQDSYGANDQRIGTFIEACRRATADKEQRVLRTKTLVHLIAEGL